MGKKNDAQQRIQDAEAKIKAERENLKKLQDVETAREVLDFLNKAARRVWHIARRHDFKGVGDTAWKMEQEIDELQEKVAEAFCGTAPRVRALAALDEWRWGPGDYCTNRHRYVTTTGDLAAILATWLFDRGLGRAEYYSDPDNEFISEDEREKHEARKKELRAQIISAFTPEVGVEAVDVADNAFSAWEEGNHDT